MPSDDTFNPTDNVYTDHAGSRTWLNQPIAPTAVTGTPTILVAARDPEVTATVAISLQGNGYRAVVAEDLSGARHVIQSGKVRAAIVDEDLPQLEGAALFNSLRRGSTLPIIVLGSKRPVQDEIYWLRGGANDFVGKPFPMVRLLARLENVLRFHDQDCQGEWLQSDTVKINLLARTAWREGREIPLCSRESSLLEVLMRHEGRVVQRQWLLTHLWTGGACRHAGALTAIIYRLRQKLDGPFRRKLIHSVRKAGLIFLADGTSSSMVACSRLNQSFPAFASVYRRRDHPSSARAGSTLDHAGEAASSG